MISAVHLIAALALLLADLSVLLIPILLLPLVLSWMQSLRRYAWLSHGDSPLYLRWDKNGWYAALRAKPELEFQVLPDDGCRLWAGWNLLCFRPVDSTLGAGFTQLVPSRGESSRAIRRLRVLLRLRGSSHS